MEWYCKEKSHGTWKDAADMWTTNIFYERQRQNNILQLKMKKNEETNKNVTFS